MCRVMWCAVLCWCLIGANSSSRAGDDVRVEALNDPSKFVFVGCETFRPDELARGLVGDPKMIVARQPEQSLEALLRLIESRLLEGYQSSGFPDAHVVAELNAEKDRIVVRITEGPGFVWGDVRISGNRAISSADLKTWLSEKHPRGPRGAVVIDTKSDDQSPVAAKKAKTPRLMDHSGNIVRGKPAWFSESALALLKASVQKGCEDQGYFAARFRLEVLREAKSNNAPLRIVFDDEGPLGTLQDVEFIGLKRHTPDEVLSELFLQRGASAKGIHAGDIERQLAASGRFVSQKVTLHHTSDAPSDLRLKIEVVEYELAPKLSEPLTRRAEILRRFALWVEQFSNQPQDFVIRWTCPIDTTSANLPLFFRDATGLRGVFALSPRRGLLASIDVTKRDGRHEPLITGIFACGRIAMWLPREKTRFDISTNEGSEQLFQSSRITLPITFSGVNLPGQRGNQGCAFALGLASNRRPDQPPFDVKFVMPPVVAMNALDVPSWKESWTDSALVLTCDEASLHFDKETGQLLEGRITHEGFVAQLQVSEGVFDEEFAKYDRLSRDVPNAFELNAPWNSCCRYLLTVIADAKKNLGPMIPGAAAVPVADEDAAEPKPEFLSDPKRAALVMQFVSGLFDDRIPEWFVPAPGRPVFWIPFAESNYQLHPYELFGPPTMITVDALVAHDSWCWKVGRQAALIMLGETDLAWREMGLELFSPKNGPLACWTSSVALGLVAPAWQKISADVGNRRLDRRLFQRDVDGLLQQGGRMQQASERFARELRTFSDEEITLAIHSLLDEKLAKSLNRQWRRWIRDEDLPDAELLPMLLVSLWQPLIEKKLSDMLIARQNVGGTSLTSEMVRYLNQVEGKSAKPLSIPENAPVKKDDPATSPLKTLQATPSSAEGSLLFREDPKPATSDQNNKSNKPDFLPSLAP